MNRGDGPTSEPLDELGAVELLRKLQGKVRLLAALGLCVGISLEDAQKLNAGMLHYPLRINGREVQVPRWLQLVLEPYGRCEPIEPIFKTKNLKYMQNLIIAETEAAIGKPKSYQALRRTFVKLCSENGVSIERVIENTGESADTIYRYFKMFKQGASENSGNFEKAFAKLEPKNAPLSFVSRTGAARDRTAPAA